MKPVTQGPGVLRLSAPPDEVHRQRAVAARGVNLLVDAGAGTGKTTLLVRRLVELVAPADDAVAALPLSRVAAVTFTRKAAGELRLRVRERLLRELSGTPSPARRQRLSAALAEADTAFIGTIHGFSDRLLRRHPVEAALSPSYEVVEDTEALVAEAFSRLLQAVEGGRLEEALAGTSCPAERAREAQAAFQDALDCELKRVSYEAEFKTFYGLDQLIARFIAHRDTPPPEVETAPFRREKVIASLDAFRDLARGAGGSGKGSRWIVAAADRARRIAVIESPTRLYAELLDLRQRAPPSDLGMKAGFPGDKVGWEAWKAWVGKGLPTALRDDVLAPLYHWLGTRLIRAFPAVVALYEVVKSSHRAVDQVDLLLELRNLLRDSPRVRGELQGLFDHVFVDEFQDTDPLQAEIILYLCEAGPVAKRWQEVQLAPGRLTLVGDPKQSIYRFRRADIAVYQAVRDIVARGPHLRVPLTANFRTEPALIAHFNERFDQLLGTPAAGTDGFDAVKGTVANQRLDAGRAGTRVACLVELPFSVPDGKADDERDEEAKVVAAWLRTRVEGGSLAIVDPVTERERPARYGDVAIMVHSTYNVGMLIEALDALCVPWTARGGSLFLQDPLHRQFLLALRALADRDDGIAQAALLREPFFSVDLRDLVRARASGDSPGDAGVQRARAALALAGDLRRRRFERAPGTTARDLLERTGVARTLAFGPNGKQRIDRLRELCFEVDRLAEAEALDYDAVTARLREWALDPVGLDPPRPVGSDAVQLMTIHQAKGLEFPVVVWWDSNATVRPRERGMPWFVDPVGGACAIDIEGLQLSVPAGVDVLAREKAFLEAERRRLVYVAATRARDVLLVPVAGDHDGTFVADALVGDGGSYAVHREDLWLQGDAPAWAATAKAPADRAPTVNAALEVEVAGRWKDAVAEAVQPRTAPVGVSSEAHRVSEAAVEEAGERWQRRPSRFGNVFGDTVHRAIGIALAEPALGPEGAVARAVLASGLDEHLVAAMADVERALAALAHEGLRRAPGPDLRLEYPVAFPQEGKLLLGYIDLLAVRGDDVVVLDFKTDKAPDGDVLTSHADYVQQVRTYGRILVELGVAKAGKVRGGLLFTEDGSLRWL